ncbi:MAG: outer membrane beta-barrel protein [bacterium]|nr:outer membrane beta-barrel protein [bacterium]
MKRFASLFIVAILMGSSTNVAAFDGQLKGFVLGGGVGGSWTSFTQELSGFGAPFDGTSDRENDIGFATDFKIGYGVNDQFLLYYVNRGSWFGLDNVLGETVTIFNSVGLVGVSYYVAPASSTYIMGLIGIASWSAVFEEDSGGQIGFGLGAGVGYEFARHWAIETTFNWGNPEDSEAGLKVSTNAFALMVMITGLAY